MNEFQRKLEKVQSLQGYDDWDYGIYEHAEEHTKKPITEYTTNWAKKTLQELKYRGWPPPNNVRPLPDPEGSLIVEWTDHEDVNLVLEFHADGDVLALSEKELAEDMEIDVYDKCQRNARRTADVFEQTAHTNLD